MAKYNRNSDKHWTPGEERRLAQLAARNTPTWVIGLKLGRTAAAVQNKASESEVSLRPRIRSCTI